jgi:hypothetical protein
MSDYDIILKADAVYLDASALVKAITQEPPGDSFVRVLVYMSRIPAFSSLIGFGEFVSAIGKPHKQRLTGVDGYFHACRMLMIDFELGKIKRAEPPDERSHFIKSMQQVLNYHSKLGGGDLWHLLASLELKRQYPNTVLLTFDKGLKKAGQSEGIDTLDGSGLDSNVLAAKLRAANLWIAT